ncbi:isoleucine--tRNA ligase [Buchnera aphidicola (Taiwanaphis decaspermi)]|uniref:isoleucine--tRNA ligase n=1 Tax=Buchnera aphidicola TaxID=9 RepID=UPI0031B88FFD
MKFNYSKTLNLPKTKFSMRAKLNILEPLIIKEWYKNNLYKIIKKTNKNKKKFFLEDGPPYANGNIHIGHSVNKILKDIIIKFKTLSGFNCSYIPSWDCHGLPIEHKIENNISKNKIKIKKENFIKLCRKYAKKQVKKQKKDFIRLGVIGDWENSYLTMNFKNQANIVKIFTKILQKGYIKRECKPVHWCINCQSSLAEAEIEHKNKKTLSSYIIFKPINENNIKNIFNIKKILKKNIYIIIWTTNIWTIPVGKAIALKKSADYVLLEIKNKILIISIKLIEKFIKNNYIKKYKIISKKIKGEKLENIIFFHPFVEQEKLPIIMGSHVTLKNGTGSVYIAPDHGIEDYITCKKYNISINNKINKYGLFKKTKNNKLDNLNIFNSNKKILEILKRKKILFSAKDIIHSYPHCWRHKSPIIFRATPQWFIDMDHDELREKSLKEIKKVKWIPKWSKNNIYNMLKNRPDWCISRQRIWGIPMCLFINKKNGNIHPKTNNITKLIIEKIKKHGIKYWFNLDKKKILGENSEKYIKTLDTLDVWFDSGSINVLKKNDENKISDIYLEGIDQHRGWFMSSLIISTIINKHAPYKKVITHGFTVDANGKKMSKSLGNTISPQEIIKKYGADILRLWVATSDYSQEMNISLEILNRIVDYYRKIRNVVRFLLSNLYDFNSKTKKIDFENMIKIDIWALKKTKKTQKKIIHFYKKYEFHKVINIILVFCSKYMSSFYFEIIKDRLYTLKKKSKERLSCQTTIYYILNYLVKWITPIIPFTSHEIWNYICKNKHKKKYIFTEEWFNLSYEFKKEKILNNEFWKDLIFLKKEINKIIEKYKKNKILNNSLEAKIILYLCEPIYKKIKIIKKEIHFIFLSSSVNIKKYKYRKNSSINIDHPKYDIKIDVFNVKNVKCERCWNYVNYIKNYNKNKKICNRCISNLIGEGEQRIFV